MEAGSRRWGRGRRAAAAPSPELGAAASAFRAALAEVEAAKAALVSAVRAGRAPGAPLAEALAGFELHLARAKDRMEGWRLHELDHAWEVCTGGLHEAVRRAEALRLGDEPPEIYEHLIAALEDLIDPLDAFADAAKEWRAHGIRI